MNFLLNVKFSALKLQKFLNFKTSREEEILSMIRYKFKLIYSLLFLLQLKKEQKILDIIGKILSNIQNKY